VILSVCRDRGIGGGLQAEKEGTSEPPAPEDGEGRGGGGEPPARLSRGTSGVAGPRNLRRGQAEEPPT
jgi:hypothetical protein